MTAAARPDRQRRLRPQRMLLPYAAALATLLTVTACSGGDPAPAATTPSVGTTSTSTTTSAPPSTTKASPTSTVDPVLAKIPAAARKKNMEGAAAYSKFYFQTLNEAFKRADPTLLTGLTTSACKTCVALQKGVNDVRKAGHHYGGDLTKINYASATEFSPNARRVLVDLNQIAVPILDKSDKKVDTTRSAKLAFVATLDYRERWIITRLQRAES